MRCDNPRKTKLSSAQSVFFGCQVTTRITKYRVHAGNFITRFKTMPSTVYYRRADSVNIFIIEDPFYTNTKDIDCQRSFSFTIDF